MAVRALRTVDVEQTLRRFPLLTGVSPAWRPLAGGLSHHIYLVEAGSNRYVLRVLEPAVSAAGLGIAPDLELANTRLAVHSGVGAAVLDVLDDVPALLLEYVAGQTLSAADIPQRLDAVAAACRRLHAGPSFGNDFDILAKRAELLELCTRNALPLPAGYLDREPEVAAIGQALAHQRLPPVPCHNDLLAENFIEQPDGRLRIVDYQLSGNNDPTFELGDIGAEADLDPEQMVELAVGYFGAELTRALAARTRLQLILSNVTWTLWFAVYDGLLRPPDGDSATEGSATEGSATGGSATGGNSNFDYRAEGADKWSQACRDLDAPDFGALLTAAAGQRTRTPLPGAASLPAAASLPDTSTPAPTARSPQ